MDLINVIRESQKYRNLERNEVSHDVKNLELLKIKWETLINKTDPNIKDKFGKTPLHYAVYNYDIFIVNELMKHGANVNNQDINGHTPLTDAIIDIDDQRDTNNYCIIMTLLENGANPHLKDNDGNTPFIKALHSGNTDIINLFIKYGKILN